MWSVAEAYRSNRAPYVTAEATTHPVTDLVWGFPETPASLKPDTDVKSGDGARIPYKRSTRPGMLTLFPIYEYELMPVFQNCL